MSQIFEGDEVIPITKIEAGPCIVTQVKTREGGPQKKSDGYEAVQIGFEKLSPERVKKPQQDKPFRLLREFRADISKYKVGDEIKANIFKKGDKVKISGLSRGHGFQGVVKRHGFHGQDATHGNKDQARKGGSIGATDPQRVFKGMRMAGRMGGKRNTISNLTIIDIIPEENMLLVKGAVPGVRNSLLEIRSV